MAPLVIDDHGPTDTGQSVDEVSVAGRMLTKAMHDDYCAARSNTGEPGHEQAIAVGKREPVFLHRDQLLGSIRRLFSARAQRNLGSGFSRRGGA